MIEEFKSIDDAMTFMREAEDRANALTTVEQRAITYGDYFMAYYPEYQLTAFGYIQTLQEIYDKEVELGASVSEAADVRDTIGRSHERGYRFARTHSVIEPDGELGDVHVLNIMRITADEFHLARDAGWDMEAAYHRCVPWALDLASRWNCAVDERGAAQ